MALFNSFTFDNENSLDSGIYITGEAVFNAPERVVEMVNVPGRNGAIAIDEGRFENIAVTYPAGCFADNMTEFAEKVANFRNILASRFTYKRLEDTYYPDEFRMGLYRSGLEVDVVNQARAGKFDIEFDCKPQRFLKSGEIPVEYTPGQTPSDEQTKTGSIVTFEAEEGTIISDVKADINPVQDLHGYDKPWAGGNGKNKLDTSGMSTAGQSGVTFSRASDGTITVGGTATASAYRIIGSIKTENGVQYTITGTPSGGANGKYRMTVIGYGYDYGSGFTFTGDGNSHDISIDIYTGYPSSGTLTFKPMIRLASVTDATFEPYSNICPISGHTEVVTHRVGKNFIPYPYRDMSKTVNGITSVVNDDGSVVLNGTATANVFLNFCLEQDKIQFEKGSYVLSSGTTLTSGVKMHSNVRVGSSNLYGVSIDSNHEATMNAQQSGLLRCYIDITSGATVNNLTIKPMLRLASDPDATYEPYNGQTYTTALGRTVYGGTLDVTSGVLTVDRAMVTLNGTEAWYLSNGGMRAYCSSSIFANAKPNSGNTSLIGLLSNQFVEKTPSQTWDGGVANIGISLDANKEFCVCLTGQKNMTVDGFKTWLANNPTQVVYELATPITVQLTPTEIKTLLGTNNIWADSGDITVKYGTNPYIIVNPTDFPSKPLLEVTGVGSFWLGDTQFTITGTSGQIIYIDCETGECYKVTGGIISPANGLVTLNRLDFPKLASGINNIQLGSGISKVKITPRWWRL